MSILVINFIKRSIIYSLMKRTFLLTFSENSPFDTHKVASIFKLSL